MQGINIVLLMGNLTRDPELRYTQSGMSYCKMGIAVSRTFQNRDGERKEDVYFANIIIWGRQGENCAAYLKKGRPVFVQGRLNMRQWETQEGEKRTSHEIVADRVQFLPRGGGPRTDTSESRDDDASAPPVPEEIKESTTEESKSDDTIEDDIPF